MDTKQCTKCLTDFPATSEYFFTRGTKKDGKPYLRSYCKSCHNQSIQESYKAGNGKASRDRATLKSRCKEYGLTPDAYYGMLEEQGHKCQICTTDLLPFSTDRMTTAHIDHDHKTGKVRGLLCHFCNTALGKFKDDPQLLYNAIDYLRRADGVDI